MRGRHRPTEQQEARTSQFDELTPQAGSVLFLGDSITEGGIWHEWFPEAAVCNRGVSGDTVDGLRRRLDQAINDPSVISLLIGTNDLTFADDTDPIVESFRLLVEALRDRAPDAILLVNSVMPRTPEFRALIHTVNESYRAIAEAHSATWINLWPALADSSGALAREYTYDGLHLRGPGYRVWADTLRPYLGGSASAHSLLR